MQLKIILFPSILSRLAGQLDWMSTLNGQLDGMSTLNGQLDGMSRLGRSARLGEYTSWSARLDE